jgi:SAM-dependent methyltransferase
MQMKSLETQHSGRGDAIGKEAVARLRAGLGRFLEVAARAALLRSYRSSTLNKAYAEVTRSADMHTIERLRREIEPIYRRDRVSAAKYVDFRLHSLRNFHRAARLGLHKQSGLRLLDIGAGPGYFIAAARALGHDCTGIDVPESYFSPLELRVYSDLLKALKCQDCVAPLAVERFVPLSLPAGPYDLITAFLVCFNRHGRPDQWGLPEWQFFVEDAIRNLRVGGRLFLGLNENPKRYGELRFYDQSLLAYFRSLGSVDGARVMIEKQWGRGLSD